MKQLLQFSLFILFSITINAQVQGPPPPCGITRAYVCDDNNDGFKELNLRELFPFSSFCAAAQGQVIESDYHPIFYYETQEDMNTETNAITDPEAYTNISNPQIIYYRANAINPNGDFEILTSYDDFVEVLQPPSPNSYNILTLCDTNANGTSAFDLTKSEESILAGLDTNLYDISFYETLADAENNINILPKESYTNITNPQKIYARVNHIVSSACFKIVELELNVKEECNDIAVFLISQSDPRPGFTSYNHLKVKNVGVNTNVSGSVEFIKDPLVNLDNVYYVSSGHSITNTSTGFILNFNNLEPEQSAIASFQLYVPVTVSLGTVLTNSASYNVTDLNLENNTSTLEQTVIGSYDPNDIAESHGPEIFYDDFTTDDYLYYTIRFQNVGTADAINVFIDNTLDSRLDKSTIQMLSSSHTNVFTRTDNQLNWQFDNIHLPSENMDEPNSHGYVYYKIKPLAGYKVGDIIPNTAEIYFDFNPAVVTNTFETEFVATLSNSEVSANEFSMSPNPANNIVDLKFNKNFGERFETTIYDIQGKIIINSKNQLQNNTLQLNISSLKSGLYFLKVDNGISEITKKLIIE